MCFHLRVKAPIGSSVLPDKWEDWVVGPKLPEISCTEVPMVVELISICDEIQAGVLSLGTVQIFTSGR